MSNKKLTFCSIVTALTALSLLSISAVEARPQPNQITGQGSAKVGASTFGNRNFSVESKATAVSPSSAMTNSNSTLINNPKTLQTQATSGSQAGSQLKGNGSATSKLTGNSTGPGGSQMIAETTSTAKVTGAKTAVVSAGLSSSLNSTTGLVSANADYKYSATGAANK